jgi:dolichol-phosphate mannosyltransferase
MGPETEMVVMRHEANVQEETYKLSVVIPCYNEMATLERCVARVLSIASDNLEIIIVDDCSTDDSFSIANTLARRHQEIRVLRHAKNTGKGAAIRSGISEASSNFVAIQDADLEYDPKDLLRLVEPLATGKAESDILYSAL